MKETLRCSESRQNDTPTSEFGKGIAHPSWTINGWIDVGADELMAACAAHAIDPDLEFAPMRASWDCHCQNRGLALLSASILLPKVSKVVRKSGELIWPYSDCR